MKAYKCPSNNGLIIKTWYMYMMKYFSTVKKTEIIKYASKLMELEKQ